MTGRFVSKVKGFFGGGGSQTEVPGLAHGGIVTRPTLAMIGEAGPEAVIPLSRSRGMGGITVNIENVNGLDPDSVAEALQDTLITKGII